MLICDAHTHGITVDDGRLLFDFHAWPLRPKEVPGGDLAKMPCTISSTYSDSIIYHSLGGIAPSGWRCDSLTYLVQFDNNGVSGTPGKSTGPPWVWGYDEICWFAHTAEADRNAFLVYFYEYMRKLTSNGFAQMPTQQTMAVWINGQGLYHANRKSDACSGGFGQEDTIKAIWNHF